MSLTVPVVNGTAAESMAPANVKLPEFLDTDPELWFMLVEQNFVTQHVTSERVKFASVVLSLKTRQLHEVRDLCMRRDEQCDYALLKAEMLKRFGESQLARTRRLLEGEQIGDRRPTQFLRHLRGLAGTAIPDDTLRAMWLGRLPSHIRHILVAQQDATLDKLADLADAIVEHASPISTGHAHAVAHTPSPVDAVYQRPPSARDNHDARIAALERELAQLRASRPTQRVHANSHARPRSKSRARRPTPSRGLPGAYWYHRPFGAKARKCIPPYTHTPTIPPATVENCSGSRH